MKFSTTTVIALLVARPGDAFVSPPTSSYHGSASSSSSARFVSADLPSPPPTNNNINNKNIPIVQPNPYGQPTDVRYSDFCKLVNADRIEKVTFSSDGTQLLGVDVDGIRVKIEALPNDPDLLTQLTVHKVSNAILDGWMETNEWIDSRVKRKLNLFFLLYTIS